MAEIKYEITEKLGVLSESTKGVTFTIDEIKELRDILNKLNL